MFAKRTRNFWKAMAQVEQGQDWILALALMAILTFSGFTIRYLKGSTPGTENVTNITVSGSSTSSVAKPTLERNVQAAPHVPPDQNEIHYRVLAQFVAKRYRVSPDVTLDWVRFAHATAHEIKLNPLLILAVISVESRFNPIAESGVGAKGLMQVIPKYHADKLAQFGGERAVFDPRTNILVGSKILKEYLRRTDNLSIALQMYAGALNDEDDTYTGKVLNEMQRLEQVLSTSKNRKPVTRA